MTWWWTRIVRELGVREPGVRELGFREPGVREQGNREPGVQEQGVWETGCSLTKVFANNQIIVPFKYIYI